MGYNYYKCNVAPFIPYMNKWHCESRSISLTGAQNFTQFKSPYIFDTAYVDIRGPFFEGNSILSEIKEIFGEKCQFISEEIDEENRYVKLICDYDIDISKLPDVIFNLKGGFELRAKNFDIFRVVLIDGKKKYLSKIVGDTRYNYWNLGEPILKNYNMVFDYEDKSVGFRESVNLIREDYFTIIVLICILLFVCIFGILIYMNRHRLFMQDFKDEDLDPLKKTE